VPTVVDETLVALLETAEGRTEVAVFRADSLQDGPVATLRLPHALPVQALDGPFVNDLVPTLDDVQKAETLANLYAKKATEWNEMDGGFSGLGIKAFLFPKGVSGG